MPYCGEDRGYVEERFTITEAGWDRLKITRWSSESSDASVLTACCSDHATQLAGNWLATGNLRSPYSQEQCLVIGRRILQIQPPRSAKWYVNWRWTA